MYCEVSRKDLLNALSVAYKAISAKSPLPILTHFLIEADETGLKISATDSELGIETSVIASTTEKGIFTTPAKTFFDIVNLLSDEIIKLKCKEDDNDFSIITESSSCSLMTLNAEDFPEIPRFDEGHDFVIKQKDFKTAIKSVLFSVAGQDETRAVLTGVCLTVKADGKAEFGATDARRLAFITVPIETENKEERQYIIPRRTLDEISKFLQANSEEPVYIGVKKSLMFFRIGNIFITSKLIDGNYPNFRQFLTDKPKYSIALSKSELTSAVKLVSVVAQDRNFFKRIKFYISEDSVKLESATQDLGSASRTIACKLHPNEFFYVAFNYQFILEALANVDGEEVLFEVSDSNSQGFIRSTENPDHICIIMPMKI